MGCGVETISVALLCGFDGNIISVYIKMLGISSERILKMFFFKVSLIFVLV